MIPSMVLSLKSLSSAMKEKSRDLHLPTTPFFQMTTPHSTLTTTTIAVVILISFILPPYTVVDGLGSASTTAVIYSTGTVCGIIANEPIQRIQCYHNNQTISVQPNISFESISGGQTFFCGLQSGGHSLLCWDTTTAPNSIFQPKRIYYNTMVQLTDLTVGDTQVCAKETKTGTTKCWRGGFDGVSSQLWTPQVAWKFRTITSGSGFTCGILRNNSRVVCWGRNEAGSEIQRQFGNLSMLSLVAGESHACGFSKTGVLVCRGNNSSGQLDVPFSSAFEFSGLALAANFSCGIRRRNGLIICWGGERNKFEFAVENVSFESLVSGLDFICGLTTSNLSLICWGPGWSDELNSDLPLEKIIPGPCVQDSCSICGMYPNSETLCGGFRGICKSCEIELPLALPLSPRISPLSPSSNGRNKLSLAFLIVGSVGAFAGIYTIVYCSYIMVPEVNAEASAVANNGSGALGFRSLSSKRQSLRTLGRRRSGSSSKYVGRTERFLLQELAAATNNFSLENKIGSGSFGIVYRGKLTDGREFAIKKGETSIMLKKFQEKESAFDSELASLSRLHHKHLVGLVGFCEEKEEKLLVYEYMINGALHDHLHDKNNVERSSSILNSWKMRIKIALETARGIEYLHNYAVPPIIHRDIKSSNILLDANWTARVSDFGLSLMGPESDQELMSSRAVGTVGYIDPEYYVLNILTAKSDVYSLGVVLLELLTGKRAVFKNEGDGRGLVGVVEYAGPLISAGELGMVLDRRVGLPDVYEAEAVELVAYTAMHCVSLEGKERPNVSDVVGNLERALALCEDSHGSFSTTTFSINSE